MKILQVCMRVPQPPADGATIAMYNLALALLPGAEVRVLALNPDKHFVDVAALKGDFVKRTAMEAVPHRLRVTALGALRNLFSNRSYNIQRFESTVFEKKLTEILKSGNYDIVQLEGLFLTPYLEAIRRSSDARVVLRAHNVEHVIWQRLASASQNPLKRSYLKLLASRMKKEELAACSAMDAIVPITPVDRDLLVSLGCHVPMQVVPVGIDVTAYPEPGPPGKEITLFHLGSMDWMPNIEGVDWFLDRVLPLLVEQVPGVRVFLAGKRMPDRIMRRADKNLVVNERIADARAFMQDKEVMIVPLLSGGGMRVKIIEGMAAGKAIVSTPVGAEGINYEAGRNILIGESPEAFCHALVQLCRTPASCFHIGREARKLAETVYDNKVLGRGLLAFYRKLIENSG